MKYAQIGTPASERTSRRANRIRLARSKAASVTVAYSEKESPPTWAGEVSGESVPQSERHSKAQMIRSFSPRLN